MANNCTCSVHGTIKPFVADTIADVATSWGVKMFQSSYITYVVYKSLLMKLYVITFDRVYTSLTLSSLLCTFDNNIGSCEHNLASE